VRFLVLGAGAIGGVVGGRLHQAGHEVTLVARGPHADALASSGLVLESPDERLVLDVAVCAEVGRYRFDDDTVVLLAVKGQDTEAALDALWCAPRSTAVVCMQNGVENERRVLRRFDRTYAMCVMLPASHLAPGVVQAHSAPVTGLLDVGCFPGGLDDRARALAAALGGATFDSRAVEDVMRWKYRKLIMNLMNAAQALCAPDDHMGEIHRLVSGEGEAVLAAAGLAVATTDEDRARRAELMSVRATASGEHRGGSSWQSLARGTGSIEADFLNGEIALLGRLHGTPAPVNARLAALAQAAVHRGDAAGSMAAEDLLAHLRAAAGGPA
jgi:2-dehydropantoate 2-reductase